MVSLPINVVVAVGSVIVPVLDIVEMFGDVKVLLVRVSVVALPTNVSVDVGSVRVPVLDMDEMIGEVSVLFVSVDVDVAVDMVSEEPEIRGNVNVLAAVCAPAPKVTENVLAGLRSKNMVSLNVWAAVHVLAAEVLADEPSEIHCSVEALELNT